MQLLAEAKASAVKLKVEQSAELNPSIKAVLGSDSVLAFEGEVFGKPKDEKEAFDRWQRVAGAEESCLISADGKTNLA